MKDIELVIKMPKRVYNYTHKHHHIANSDVLDIKDAIINGVSLPEGHGRLIDADEFHHTLEDMPMRDTDKWFNWLQKACIRLADAPTIVEADRSKDIKQLPSVTPQPKTGHWTRTVDKAEYLVWECNCGWQQRFATNYCPNCGAKMTESEE